MLSALEGGAGERWSAERSGGGEELGGAGRGGGVFGEESSVCTAVFKIGSASRVCGFAAVPRETVWPAEIGRNG